MVTKYLSLREFDTFRETMKGDFDDLKTEIYTIKNNHLAHIQDDINKINRNLYMMGFVMIVLSFFSGANFCLEVLKILGVL